MASELKTFCEIFSARAKMDALMASEQSLGRRPLRQLLVISKLSEEMNPSDYVQQV